MQQALEGAELVFHLASGSLPQSSNRDPHADVQVNLLGTLNLLEAARLTGVRRLVMVSSGGTVYGIPQAVPIPESHPTEPICSYGITKLAMEKYVALYRQLHGLQGLVLRVANPFGPRQRLDAAQGVVPVFLGKALRDEPLQIWGDGTTVRDFLDVADVVAALLAAARYNGNETLFNIGSGQGLSLNQLIVLLEQQLNRSLMCNIFRLVVVMCPPMFFALIGPEKLWVGCRRFLWPMGCVDSATVSAAESWNVGHGIAHATGQADLGEQAFNRMQHRAVVTKRFIGVILPGEPQVVEAAEGSLSGPEHCSHRKVDGFWQGAQLQAVANASAWERLAVQSRQPGSSGKTRPSSGLLCMAERMASAMGASFGAQKIGEQELSPMRSDSSVDQHTFLGVQMTMNGVIAIELAAQFAEQRANVASAIGNAMEAGVLFVFSQHPADVGLNLALAETDE